MTCMAPVVGQDEDGMWCAHVSLRPGVGAVGEGGTPEEAVADLLEALDGLIEEFGTPWRPGTEREAP